MRRPFQDPRTSKRSLSVPSSRVLALLDWFLARDTPRFVALSPTQVAQGRLVTGLVLAWTGLAGFFAVYITLTGGPPGLIATCLVSFSLWAAMLAYTRRSGDVRRVGSIFCALLAALIACGAFTSTGAAALMGPWGLVTPLLAMFVLGVRSGALYGVAMFALAVLAAILQSSGVWTIDPRSVADFVRPEKHIVSGSFVLATMLVIGALYESAQRHARDAIEASLRELVATREQLVRAERLSVAAELASAVAHEINTPLGILQANLEALQARSAFIVTLWTTAKDVSKDLAGSSDNHVSDHAVRLRSASEGAERAASDMAPIVEDALAGVARIADLVSSFERLAAPSHATVLERVDVGALVEDCVASSRQPIEIDAPTECATLASRVDLRAAIIEVLAFLGVDDAAGPSLGAIRIGLRAEGGQALLALSRFGRTLSLDERLRVFEPHLVVRTEQTIRLDTGLALAHQLLVSNGAELTVDDDGGDGLRFLVSFSNLPMSD